MQDNQAQPLKEAVMDEPVVVPPVVEVPKVEEDIVTRASKFKPETVVKQELDEKFNINELDATIDKLPDPILKEQVLGLKKSLLKGENQKYQEIANLRKQYEQELATKNQWTPEKVQGLLADQNFVTAARSIVERDTSNSSMLSESERKIIEQTNQQVQALMNQNQVLLKVQQDEQIKRKYADYDPAIVDRTIQDLSTGKVQATREDIWKVINHDANVERAYKLGLQDKNTQNQERASGMTYDTGRNVAQPTTLERQKGESVSKFMQRSYAEHAKKK